MMTENDKAEFKKLLEEIGAVYKTDVSNMLGFYWRNLAPIMDIGTMIGAIDAHAKDSDRGRFFPNVADIIAQIEKASPNVGHVTSDEAWAIALESYDESATVCITPEIMQARSAAQLVMDEGDKVGARMAFKGAYERIMADPEVTHSRPEWFMSLGHDPDSRRAACDRAAELGRIGTGTGTCLLGPPDDKDATPILPGSRKDPGLRLIGGKEFLKPDKGRAGHSTKFKIELEKFKAIEKSKEEEKELARLNAQGKASDMSRDDLEAERARQLEALAAKLKSG